MFLLKIQKLSLKLELLFHHGNKWKPARGFNTIETIWKQPTWDFHIGNLLESTWKHSYGNYQPECYSCFSIVSKIWKLLFSTERSLEVASQMKCLREAFWIKLHVITVQQKCYKVFTTRYLTDVIKYKYDCVSLSLCICSRKRRICHPWKRYIKLSIVKAVYACCVDFRI